MGSYNHRLLQEEGTVSMEHQIDCPEISGFYLIDAAPNSNGTDYKWYVVRYEDIFRNGGQDTKEYEHQYGFASKAGAIKWANKDAQKIREWNTKWNQ